MGLFGKLFGQKAAEVVSDAFDKLVPLKDKIEEGARDAASAVADKAGDLADAALDKIEETTVKVKKSRKRKIRNEPES